MAEMFYESDVKPGVLNGKKIAVIGYGSQGRAQALNLKDSGLDVVVGVRPGKSAEHAKEDGMVVKTVAQATKLADIVHILLPDESQAFVYKNEIEPNLKKGASLSFSHGFNIHYNQIIPRDDLDVFLVAPKGPGHTVRETFTQGIGVPGLIAIYQDATGNAMDYAKYIAKGIGAMRAGVYLTTFKEETETDLFGEQVDLCGGISALIKASFEVLVDAGYQPEMAYFETVHEVKLIVDLIHEGGLERMWDSVSNTAEYGGMTVGPTIINEDSIDAMYIALERIQNGQFAKDFILEGLTNYTVLRAMERLDSEHPMEIIGKEIRSNIPWLAEKNKKTKSE